ncbi:anaphase-promoting complex subunit 5 isoform X2 [Mus musculus]|uniref:anaphase-promoting complex subunit 5 isoform X2 n=1 Tax=Mus musculus TaxID=10090 RepID=UPI0003D72B74|nr:anaphase-promoting complex subunit 5 isoform X2 [Mus musculus]|eukprot:XP_006530492.1 PREDICTED: anaphase-promoting complex subunit 5 isoform X2 [Mus musculus]
MMTNGVVHANLFGIKDWVTPYKIAVLVLLNEMGRTGEGAVSLVERRKLNQLLLPLLQGPDITLSKLYKLIEESCPQLANSVQIRIKLMAEGELKDMEQFFDDLSDSFSGTEPEVHKTSVVGLFLRHMILAYSKLSFSQVFKLYTALQQYFQNGEKKTVEDADMDREDGEKQMEKEELDVSVREEEVSCSGPLSQKQAEFFLSQQAALLKNDETKALTPASLQKELNNLLKFNPDFAEAHYLSYLNNLRVQDVFSSTHSLLHYFDRLILTGAEGKSNGEEGYGRSLRYAALNLAALHCRFGHYQQAELALQEAIRIAQESNDHVCLQHCLSWLYVLGQKRADSYVLLEHSVKKAVHFGLPYLASLGIQSLVQQRAFAGKTANKLMDALKDSDLLHWKHSLSELIDISIAQKTAIWRLYGRSTMALQQAQMLLSMNSLESLNAGVQQNNTESFAVALCHLAELHAEQGCFAAAGEVLKHLKDRFPPNSQHAQESSRTAGSEPNDRGTQATTEVADVLSEAKEHRNGHQCPPIGGRAVLAIFVPDHRHACAPGSSGPLQRIPIAVLGLRNCAQLGLCPAHPWNPGTGLNPSPHGYRAHPSRRGCPGQRSCHVLSVQVPSGFGSVL